MKNHIVKIGLLATSLFAAFSSQAGIFTCDGYVKDVIWHSTGRYKVVLENANGVRLDGAYIPNTPVGLDVVPRLLQQQNNGVEYVFVIEHIDTGDTRCRDNNEGAGMLVGYRAK